MENSPFLSIIIPVYNRQYLVQECIQSILAQTENDWEAIIVDDGSTDQTWDVLEKFSELDGRIRIFKRIGDPKGANRCRNQGIAASKGEYLFFLDSDDLIGPDFVLNRKKYARKYPEIEMLVFPEANFETDPKKYHFKQVFIRDQNEDDFFRFFQRDSPWLTSGPILQKRLLHEGLEFNEMLTSGQDWDFFIRIFISGISYKKIDLRKNPDFFHRMSKNYPTITNTNRLQLWFLNKKTGLKTLLPLLKNRGFFQKTNPYRKTILEYYMWFCKQNADMGSNKTSLELWKFFYQHNVISWLEWFIWAIYLHRFMYRRGRIKRYYMKIIATYISHWNYASLEKAK